MMDGTEPEGEPNTRLAAKAADITSSRGELDEGGIVQTRALVHEAHTELSWAQAPARLKAREGLFFFVSAGIDAWLAAYSHAFWLGAVLLATVFFTALTRRYYRTTKKVTTHRLEMQPPPDLK